LRKESSSQEPRWKAIRPSRTWKKLQPRRPADRAIKDRDVAILVDRLDEADHLRRGGLPLEHRLNGALSLDRLLRDLMVHRILVIERGERVGAAAVECLDPSMDEFSRLHAASRPIVIHAPRRRRSRR
jgi:hypothetical protein